MLKEYALFIGLILSVVISFYAGHWLTNNHWSAKWSDREAQYAEAQVVANEAVRAQERLWQDKIEKVHDEAKKRNETIAADAAELSDVVARLRKQIADRAANSKSSNSTATDISRTAATDRVMYSVMLEGAIIRAEQYAGFADQSRTAGLACQAAYNALQ
jgi:hypothetical protein